MTRQVPAITVGMPVYNGAAYLQEAVESILQQTNGDFVLLISDNASTDGTEAICRAYAAQDPRVVYTRNEVNIGACRNYNRLFQMAESPYFRWFNADDVSDCRLHEKCLQTLQQHSDAVLAYGKTRLIDQHGMVTRDYDDHLDLQQANTLDRIFAFHQSVGLTNAIYGLMRSSAVAKTKLMGDGSYPAADTSLMAQLVLLGKFIEIPEQLFCRRIHDQASSCDKQDSRRQCEFWNGDRRNGFTYPTWKRHRAMLSAVNAAPIGFTEKWRVRTYLLRRLFWDRGKLMRELIHW